ncbi:MAG TPA: hypothetical protein VLT36_17260 [Candidatus Dormibacteraeota bacterium]|nr:hypothetical protein [Candidatus Dormibacteraeota bacterium]
MTEWPETNELWEFPFRRRSQPSLLRAVKYQLEMERKYNDKVLSHILQAIDTQIVKLEERMTVKLAEIDTSLNLIAREIARHSDDPEP